MTHVASGSTLAAGKIIVNHLFSSPIDAGDGFVCVDWRVSPVVLPVMSIDTFVFFVLGQIEDTEFSLVVKHVEILVFNVVVNKFGLNLFLTVSVCAKLSVGTLRDWVWPMGAETLAIVLGMVLFLHRGVALCTVISQGAFLTFFYPGTHVSGVKIASSTSVLFVVVVHAHFVIMFYSYVAGGYLKDVEVKLL